MAKWLITFENGYCGCNIEEIYEGDYLDAIEFADEYLPDYAETYAYVHFGWGEEYTEEEYEGYFLDCYYSINVYEDDDDDE